MSGFLSALGCGAWAPDAKAKYEQRGAQSIRVSVAGSKRDYVDLYELISALKTAPVGDEFYSIVRSGKWYIVSGAVRTSDILIAAEDRNANKVAVSADLADQLGANVEASVTAEGDLRLSYKGNRPLVIGVEMIDCRVNKDGILTYKNAAPAAAIRADDEREKDEGERTLKYKAFVGDPTAGDIFVDLPRA